MIRIVDKEEYRICADCDGAMRKMPGLNGVWMCERCSSLNYRLPEDWEFPAQDEEEEQDEALYREEISGE